MVGHILCYCCVILMNMNFMTIFFFCITNCQVLFTLTLLDVLCFAFTIYEIYLLKYNLNLKEFYSKESICISWEECYFANQISSIIINIVIIVWTNGVPRSEIYYIHTLWYLVYNMNMSIKTHNLSDL